MSDTSAKVLMEEIDSAIKGITTTDSAKCAAHEPMARGVVVLLRVARVTLQQQTRVVALAGSVSAVVSATILIVASILKAFSAS